WPAADRNSWGVGSSGRCIARPLVTWSSAGTGGEMGNWGATTKSLQGGLFGPCDRILVRPNRAGRRYLMEPMTRLVTPADAVRPSRRLLTYARVGPEPIDDARRNRHESLGLVSTRPAQGRCRCGGERRHPGTGPGPPTRRRLPHQHGRPLALRPTPHGGLVHSHRAVLHAQPTPEAQGRAVGGTGHVPDRRRPGRILGPDQRHHLRLQAEARGALASEATAERARADRGGREVLLRARAAPDDEQPEPDHSRGDRPGRGGGPVHGALHAQDPVRLVPGRRGLDGGLGSATRGGGAIR